MGWKSTLTITRDEAITAIITEMAKLHQKTNSELEDIMGTMFGDDADKPYFGHNFWIVDELEEDE